MAGALGTARRLVVSRISGPRWALRLQIFRLALPVVMEQILATLTNIVDMMMVGRLGPEAVAAIGLSNHPLFFSMAVFMGIGVGATALVARGTGAGDVETVDSAVRQSFWMALIAAILVGAGYYLMAPEILRLMGAEPGVEPLGVAFLRWSVPGYVAMQWSQVMTGALRGRGDTVTPLYVGIGVNIINVILGYSLIYGHLGLPALGLVGSALGTTIARSLGAVALLAVLLSGKAALHLRVVGLFRWDTGTMWRILRVGLPASGERAFQSLGMISFTRVVASLGTTAVAAHQIAINAESISYMPAVGLAAAGTALVGQRLGSRDPEGAAEVARETTRISVAVMFGATLFFLVTASPYVSLYTRDPAVQQLAAQVLTIAAFVQIPMGIAFSLSGALRGAGDTLPMMAVTAIGVWFIRLTMTTVLLHFAGWGLAGAWIAMNIDWSFRALCAFWRFRSGVWRAIRV